MEDLVGTRIDDWKISRKIAEGAFGAVYEARRKQERSAVKVALPNSLGKDGLQRFRREAHILMEISDPNVVRCIHAGESEGFVYLSLEFLAGGSLQDQLQAKERLTVPQAVFVVRRILRGLAAVHAKGILHRDLKPDNVMLSGDGTPKLIDFGLAKGRNNARITMAGSVLGTVDYMSPEQFEFVNEVDQRTDLYAVGAMLFHLVTGKVPYSGRSSLAVLKQHKDAPIPDASKTVKEAKSLVSAINKLMAKNPDDRPPSAEAAVKLFDGMAEEPLVKGAKVAAEAGDAPSPKRPSRSLDALATLGVFVTAGAALDVVLRERGIDLLEQFAQAAQVREVIGTDYLPWAVVAGVLVVDRVLLARITGRGLLGWLGRIVGIGK